MGEKLLLNKAAKIAVEDIVQKVMDIFEAEDGRVFEEKKKEVIEYLKIKRTLYWQKGCFRLPLMMKKADVGKKNFGRREKHCRVMVMLYYER